MKYVIDIDGTICKEEGDVIGREPYKNRILQINKLYDEGHEITYWTARGSVTGIDWGLETEIQLEDWGCKYHKLSVGEKPAYDLLICDKTKRIEEI